MRLANALCRYVELAADARTGVVVPTAEPAATRGTHRGPPGAAESLTLGL
jgi:hypothetical protein